MGKKIVIKSVSTEALAYLQENYNIEPGKLQELQNKEVELSDEVIAILEKAKDAGVVEYDIGEQEKDVKGQNPEEQNPEEPNSEEPNSEEQNPEEQNPEEQNLEEANPEEQNPEESNLDEQNQENLTPKQKEEKLKAAKERAVELLEKSDIFQNLEPEERERIKSAYNNVLWHDMKDIYDENFLVNRVNNDNCGRIAKLQQLHLAVRGGLKMQERMHGTTSAVENIDEPKQQYEVKIGDMDNPQMASHMDSDVKEKARQEMAYKIKKYIEKATINKTTEQTLLFIGDFKKYMEDVKKDTANSIDAGEDTEAVKTYISEMEASEIGSAMVAAKDGTENLKIKLDEAVMSNPENLKATIDMIAKAQESVEGLCTKVPLIDEVSLKMEIKDMKDVSTMVDVFKEIKEAGLAENKANITADIDISSNDPTLAVAVSAAMDKNGVEPENDNVVDKENILENVGNVPKGVAVGATIGAIAEVGGIDGINAEELINDLQNGADVHPNLSHEQMQENTRENNFERNEPGMMNSEEE